MRQISTNESTLNIVTLFNKYNATIDQKKKKENDSKLNIKYQNKNNSLIIIHTFFASSHYKWDGYKSLIRAEGGDN